MLSRDVRAALHVRISSLPKAARDSLVSLQHTWVICPSVSGHLHCFLHSLFYAHLWRADCEPPDVLRAVNTYFLIAVLGLWQRALQRDGSSVKGEGTKRWREERVRRIKGLKCVMHRCQLLSMSGIFIDSKYVQIETKEFLRLLEHQRLALGPKT